ncbi:MAG: choice-of-anchor D domain-containing protein, partial [Candidatus Syntrophosphaera sp.]
MRKLLLLIPLLLSVCFVFAQASEYTFAQSTVTYTEITGGTVVTTGTSDDVQYAITPPFDFVFGGELVTAMGMSTNGYLSFNAGTSSFGYTAISSSTTGAGVIAAMSRDLRGRADGEMRWEVFGTAPDRYAVFQWKNWTAYGSTYVDDNWNFQIVIYETTNNIEINYGPFTWTSTYSNTAQVGIRGTTNVDFSNRTTTTDWSATTAGTANNATCTISTTIYPPNGLQFAYDYPVASTPPNAPVLLSPANDGWALNDATLNWMSGGGLPDTYDVYLDTVDGSTLVSDDQLGTSYGPTLTAGTTYYWKVVAANSFGEGPASDVWSFTTPTTTQLAESFEDTTFPPPGWANGTSGNWTRSTSTPVYHGVAKAYKYTSTSTAYQLSTPMLTISATSTLDFWTYATNTSQVLQVVYSPDRVTWTQVGSDITYAASYTYYNQVVDLSSLAGNDYYLAFQTPIQTSTGSVYVDYVFGPEITPLTPGAPTLTAPADLATDVIEFATFSWSASTSGGVPTGYDLYLDTVDGTTLYASDVTSPYTVTTALAYNTTYYWTVVAYNGAGNSPTPTPFSFTTRPDPLVSTFPWMVDFGTDGSPFPPTNWTKHSGLLADPTVLGTHPSGSWYQDDFANVVTSPSNESAKINIYSTLNGWLITPPIQMPGTGYQLEFDIALTDYYNAAPPDDSTGVDDRFIVLIGDGTSWSPANIVREWNNTGSTDVYYDVSYTGDHYIIPLDAYTGTKYIAFYGESTVSNADNDFFLDNVWVRETPSTPVMTVTPDSWDFGTTAVGGTASKQFTISNTGTGTLNITALTIDGTYYSLTETPTLPVGLATGETATFTVQYAPTTSGTHTGTVYITDDLTRTVTQVPLTGTAALVVFMQDGSTTLAEGESWNFYDSGGPSNNYSVSEDYTYTFYPPTGYLVHSSFISFSTEGNYDFLYVYDGSATTDPLLGTYDNSDVIPDYTSTHASGALTFRFTSDSSVTNPGWEAVISLVPRPVDPVFSYTPASLSFSTPANGTSAWQNVTVSNTGSGTLNLAAADVTIIGTDATEFEYDPVNLPAALAGGESVLIPVRFIPTTEGAKTATLQMTYDAANYDVALSGTATPEGTVIIGDGTDGAPKLPINAYYGYTYSQVIYLQSELGGACIIDSIAYYWGGATDVCDASNNWTVYMGTTNLDVFATNTDWLPLGSLTQVFSGEVALPMAAGWITIVLDNPFVYTGTDNLVIGVDENEPGYDYPYGEFHCTASTGVRGLLYYSDGTNPDPAAPPTASYMRSAYANLTLYTEEIVAAPPAAPNLTYPANGGINLPVGGFDLTWSPSFPGGLPDYYAVYMSQTEANIYGDVYFETTGTNLNPTNPPLDLYGNPQTAVAFNYDERWYWTVEAINDLGSAVVDPPHWFEIASDPTITVFPHLQDYETWPPLNWDLTGGTHSFVQYLDGTGNNWAKANFWGQSEGSTDIMTSPPILSTTDLRLNFTWSHQYNATYPNDALTVQISADGTTWTDLWYKAAADLESNDGALSTTPGTGVTETLMIPPTYTGSLFWLRFYGYSGWGPDLFIDNFILDIPLDHDVKPVSIGGIPGEVVPALPITPTAVVSNIGLNAESFNVQISWDTYVCTQSVTSLPAGESTTVTFATFTPTENVADLITVTTLLGTDMDTSNDQITEEMICLPLDKQVYADVAYSGGGTTGPATFNLMTPGTITDLSAANPWPGYFLVGADWINSGWYGPQYDDGTLTTDNYWLIDTATGAGTNLGNVGAALTGIAYDDNSGTLYGVGNNGVDNLYTLNPATGLATLVGTITGNTGGLIIGIAYDNTADILYAVDLGLDALFTVDPVTLVATMVGYLGIDLNYAQDIAFDQDTGNLYLAGYAGSGALYWINTTNGAAYKIGDFQGGWEMTGFAIPFGMELGVPDLTIGADGTLSWTAVTGAASYNIYSCVDPYGTFTLLHS